MQSIRNSSGGGGKIYRKVDTRPRAGGTGRKPKILGWDLDEYRRMGAVEMRERERIKNKSRESQNDIKKLRRENEQLRREIWSLRDEYDKLEDLLKKQKSREESDEPEVRSELEGGGSECSDEEEDDDEEEDEDDEEDEGSESDDDEANDQGVRQENAENQKISSEKLSVTPIQHRTLPVVHEEEEPKREKDQPYISSTTNLQEPIMQQQLPPTYPYHSTSFEQPYPVTTTSFGYPTDSSSPFVFPPSTDVVDHVGGYSNVPMLLTTYPQVHHPPPVITQTSSFDMGIFDGHPHVATPPPPPGWQSSLSPRSSPSNFAPDVVRPPEEFLAPALVENGVGQKSLAERRRAFFKHYSADSQRATGSRDNSAAGVMDETSRPPKHFFAPLPAKCRSPAFNNGHVVDATIRPMDDVTMVSGSLSDNGNSPSSEKTGSTVISRERYEKVGSSLFDNGNVSCLPEDRHVGSFFGNDHFRLSSNAGDCEFFGDSANPLTKSVSCQDLNSRLSFVENLGSRNEQLAKSDSTLDNMSIKAFKSQLNITLRQPGSRKSLSPDTPEIPKLPSIDYKLFNNPFLQNFEQAYQNFPLSRTEGQSPLSLQVCESPVSGAGYSSPVRMQPTFTSPSEQPEYAAVVSKRKDLERLRLMIPSSKIFDSGDRQEYQVTSFESPSPHTLQIPPMTPYELEALRRMPTGTTPLGQSPLSQATPRLYQNVPFTPGMRHETPIKISTMTQTSPEGPPQDSSIVQIAESPTDSQQQKKRRSRKDKSNSVKEKAGSIKRRSPTATRRGLKKQTSVASSKLDIPETPRSRAGDSELEKNNNNNESRSSSSGQDSPTKKSLDQTKRVSLYFSARKRPSLTSSRTSRSRSVENSSRNLESAGIALTERERTNSISSREATRADKQQRRTSTSSGSVPWCACWGNGCI